MEWSYDNEKTTKVTARYVGLKEQEKVRVRGYMLKSYSFSVHSSVGMKDALEKTHLNGFRVDLQ